MTSLHLVDPELRPLLEQFPTHVLSDDNLAELRAAERAVQIPVAPNSVALMVREVTGPDGNALPLHIYLPAASLARPFGCIYHVHGGGYIGGSPAQNEFLLRPLAEELGCAIVSVDYRLAPENSHPAPIEDCYAGLAWTFSNAEQLGIDPARIGLMGESAGGGLAAALALLVRDRALARLAFQVLTYPMIDDRTCTADPHPFAGEYIWTPHNNRFGWAALLGQEPGGEGTSPYAAASRAEDLSLLPPTFLSSGALDLFVEENIEYARRLIRAGVATELHVYPGAFHGFDILPLAAVSRQAIADRKAALRRFLSGTPA
jgi:acetyl esterase/lipase